MPVELPVPSPSVGMTLAAARTIVRASARNGTDTTAYGNAAVDQAIATVGQRFCRITRYLSSSSTADASTTTGVVTCPVDRAYLVSALLEGHADALDVVPYEQLWRAIQEQDTSEHLMAFTSTTSATLYPVPTTGEETVTFLYWQPFTTFTAGTATPDSVVLNIPEAILAEILPWGPPALLQHHEPEHQYHASPAWDRYLEIERSFAGAGTGVRKVQMRRGSDL